MRATTQHDASDFLGQAAQTLDSAMQAGIRLQNEATRWWSGMLQGANPMQGFQDRAQEMTADAMPKTKNNVDQYLSFIGRGYQMGMNLMRRAIQTSQSTSYAEAQNNMRSLWEESLGALRSNAAELAKINMRIMETWSSMGHPGATMESGTEKPKAMPGEGSRPRSRSTRARGNK